MFLALLTLSFIIMINNEFFYKEFFKYVNINKDHVRISEGMVINVGWVRDFEKTTVQSCQ